jgi:hypothetical protein
MDTHVGKTSENKTQAVADSLSQRPINSKSALPFIDNRPEAIAQRKLQEAITNSPRMQQLRGYQEMANNRNSASQANPLQAVKPKAAQPLPPIVQKATKLLNGEKECSLDEVHDLLVKSFQWYSVLNTAYARKILAGFIATTNYTYNINNLAELANNLYNYYVDKKDNEDEKYNDDEKDNGDEKDNDDEEDYGNEEDYEDDEDYDDDEEDYDEYDKYDEYALEYLEKQDLKKGKKKNNLDKEGKKEREEELKKIEENAESKKIKGVLNRLQKEKSGEKKGPPGDEVVKDFEAGIKKALAGFENSDKRKKDTRYAEIFCYSQEGPVFSDTKTFSDGSPEGHSATYGLVPTERGDFTKLQYGILNDAVYESGNAAILVEWKKGDKDSNKAQGIKIKALIEMLSTFPEIKGSLTFYAILNTVDDFNKATMMNYLLGNDQKPVLSGGEAFDKIIFDKGKKFWSRHSKTGKEEKNKRKHHQLPFMVIWFNRTNVDAKYDKEKNIKEKGQHLREMRHKTNEETMTQIINKYKSVHRIIFAGDKGADTSETGISTPLMDLRESWKLPGHDTMLSQDETFDELAAISGQEILHIGFRSGRLESLVMQPKQKVIMLENNLSVIGNSRANLYYAYSKRGTVFNPEGLEALHVDPGTLKLAGELKKEEKDQDDSQRYSIPELPKAIPNDSMDKSYEKYLEKFDEVKGKKTRPDVDDSLIKIVGQLAANIENALPKLDINWTINMDNDNRSKSIKVLKSAFNIIIDENKNIIAGKIKKSIYMPREPEIKTIGLAIFESIEYHADKLDEADFPGINELGGMDKLKTDLKETMKKLRLDMGSEMLKEAFMNILAIQSMMTTKG